MRFLSYIAFFGISSVIGGSQAVNHGSSTSLGKRQYDAQVGLLTDLYDNIRSYTGPVNDTVLALPADADDPSKAAAAQVVNDNVVQVADLVNQTTFNVPAAAKLRLRPRQSNTGVIVTILGDILSELSGTLNNVIEVLGLETLLGLGGLTGALSGLVAALQVVVDDLLAVVKLLLDGVLTDLSVALAGIQI